MNALVLYLVMCFISIFLVSGEWSNVFKLHTTYYYHSVNLCNSVYVCKTSIKCYLKIQSVLKGNA